MPPTDPNDGNRSRETKDSARPSTSEGIHGGGDTKPWIDTENSADREALLAERLDQLLQSLWAGDADKTLSLGSDAEGKGLRQVVEQLHGMSELLSYSASEAVDKPPSTKVDPPEDNRQRIGKYLIRRTLGQGGQASAYLGFDPDLQRHVVIKLYHAALSDEARDAVLREGRALARIRTDYVAQCYGAEDNGGVPYLLIEYVPGKNVAELYRKRRPKIAEALELVCQLAEGLIAVHACGLIHRDIKPANIIVGDDGKPHLVDFGLTAPLASDELERVSGTPAYMAPEQARGEFERIDHRSDIFGLGAVLYELLTGRPPYLANNKQSLLALASSGDVTPPSELDAAIPDAVSNLCMQCLAKDPVQRPTSAGHLVSAIQRLRGRKAASIIRVAAALFLGMAGLTVIMWLTSRFPSQMPDTSETAMDTDGETMASVSPTERRFHPDGRLLRQDFGLTVELIGGVEEASGVVGLNAGDKVKIRVEADHDCYVGVWSVPPHPEEVVQILPNEAESNHRVRAGIPRVIPGQPDIPGKTQQEITATVSQGAEFLHVVASTRPIPATEGDTYGPYVVLARNHLQDKLRGLVIGDRQSDGRADPSEVSEVVIPFQVAPHNAASER